MKPKEYEQAIELVFDGQGSHQGELYVLVDWELTPEEAVEQGLETDLLDGVLVAEYPSEEEKTGCGGMIKKPEKKNSCSGEAPVHCW